MVSNQATTSKSLFSRPLDLVYFGYFASHIPITAFIDLQSLYPAEMVPQGLKDVVAWYVATFKDPFMGATAPMYWFQGVVFCEMFLQLPFFFAACYGLWKNSLYIRLPLIVYASHVATTLAPTLAELLYNPEYGLTDMERYTLCGFYLPYLIIPLMILIDSYVRISKVISPASTHSKTD
ncbi:transmembrane protein 6/97 [Zychaea mexicana]|uniref:transmembrane protein 6/97 n=1 Tax=Zychaea mexicana TaxID=64656 RepID=UPI0022FEA123|nr:transmembrane protein 6/97 [Zychaea mexicana]KAI9496865.1 transmembrane protein 6/97 [Zychaea mexicana]